MLLCAEMFTESIMLDKYDEAARLCPKVCGHDLKRWEDWIFVFTQKHRLQVRTGSEI